MNHVTFYTYPVSKKFLPKWKIGILEKIFAKNGVFGEDFAKKWPCQQNYSRKFGFFLANLVWNPEMRIANFK